MPKLQSVWKQVRGATALDPVGNYAVRRSAFAGYGCPSRGTVGVMRGKTGAGAALGSSFPSTASLRVRKATSARGRGDDAYLLSRRLTTSVWA